MKWLLFAWKNVLRNRRRTIVTVLLASIGTAAVLMSSGFALRTYDALKRISALEIGHVVIAHAKFFDGNEETPLQFGLEGRPILTASATSDPRVAAVLPRLEFSGLISNGEKTAIYLGTGIDPAAEARVEGAMKKMDKGSALSARPLAADNDAEVVLAKDLARDLNAEVGSSLTLLSTTRDGVLNAVDVRVAGIYSTGTPELDKRALMAHIDTAQELLASDRVSTLAIYLHDVDQAAEFRDQWLAQHPGLAAKTWEELAFFYAKVRALYDRIFGVLGLIIVVMVFVAVTNTMSMTVAERTREIGTLAAMGTSPVRIISNFAMEAGIIGAVSALAGMLIAGSVTVLLNLFPVMMPPPPGRTDGYPLQFHFDAGLYLQVGGIIFLVAVLAALITARRGARRPIVEALHYV